AGAMYANLKGPDGRAGNVLVNALLEHRFEARSLEIPLRFSAGYLPRNGPVVRLATGLAFPLGTGTRLTLDLLSPTFWAARDRTAFSFDLGAEISFVP
ncbi:MAG: hypothetical protein FJ104_11765, partial [Deltaproteobacteria bacterium]|nr:hypothetical protein [Deltaproteobacteria bacterium]